MILKKKEFGLISRFVLFGILMFTYSEMAGQSGRLDLGMLEHGEKVSFVKTDGKFWGIEIAGGQTPRIFQAQPARIEIYKADDDIRTLLVGYKKVTKSAGGIQAMAEIKYDKAVIFRIRDSWSIKGPVLSLSRKVDVEGNTSGEINSSVVLTLDLSVSWTNMNCLAPGALYGDPAYDGELSPGGTSNYAARHFIMREDILPAPLFALSFNNGTHVAMLNPSPKGETTVDETKLVKDVMTDSRYLFGALGAWQNDQEPISFGFVFPGTANVYPRTSKINAPPRWIRRYHPIIEGVNHSYHLDFRFGRSATFRDVTRESWRWAWNSLKPEVYPIDVEQMRRILTDHLAPRLLLSRGGLPYLL